MADGGWTLRWLECERKKFKDGVKIFRLSIQIRIAINRDGKGFKKAALGKSSFSSGGFNLKMLLNIPLRQSRHIGYTRLKFKEEIQVKEPNSSLINIYTKRMFKALRLCEIA